MSPTWQGVFAAGAKALPAALAVALAGEACVVWSAVCAGLMVKVWVHTDHLHAGKHHIQINWWIDKVEGSGRAYYPNTNGFFLGIGRTEELADSFYRRVNKCIAPTGSVYRD